MIKALDSSSRAVIVSFKKFDDIEDALQYYTSIHHKPDYFISSDKKLQKASMSALPVVAIDHFLKEVYRG